MALAISANHNGTNTAQEADEAHNPEVAWNAKAGSVKGDKYERGQAISGFTEKAFFFWACCY